MNAQEGNISITLPDGKQVEYPQSQWQEMLENVQQACDEHFESGPSNLKEAYQSFLQIGLSGAQRVQSGTGQRAQSKSS